MTNRTRSGRHPRRPLRPAPRTDRACPLQAKTATEHHAVATAPEPLRASEAPRKTRRMACPARSVKTDTPNVRLHGKPARRQRVRRDSVGGSAIAMHAGPRRSRSVQAK